jgi:hypothetical protein
MRRINARRVRSWPDIDDRAHPRACVRFDQRAVYLGTVSGDEFCPSWLLGTTESILIQPAALRKNGWGKPVRIGG